MKVVVSVMQAVILCSPAPSTKDLDSEFAIISVGLIINGLVWGSVELAELPTSAVVLVLTGISVLALWDGLPHAFSGMTTGVLPIVPRDL